MVIRFYSFPSTVRADNDRFDAVCDSHPFGYFHGYVSAGPHAALVDCYVARFIKKDGRGGMDATLSRPDKLSGQAAQTFRAGAPPLAGTPA